MRRNAELDLKKWYHSKNRKPLILRGARQVGKSTLVRNFARSNDLDLIEINFEKTQLKTPDQSLDLKKILPEIEYITKKKINSKSLLFLDEIQDNSKMITCLRFFKEDRPDIPVVAAGSLLEFALTINEISIPVGRVQYYHLGPFTFSEFLEANNKFDLLELMSSPKKIPTYAENELNEFYMKYLFVGGMPEPIQTYIDSAGSIDDVRLAQDSIMQSFRDDFHKYSTRAELPRVRKAFDSITRIAGHKLKYTEIDPDEKARDIKRALELLIFARVFLPVTHSNGTKTPLKAFEDTSVFKLYFLDVGLLGSLHRIEWKHISQNNPISGLLAEQFVAQHLIAYNGPNVTPELHYWLNDKKSHRAEVDFLIQSESRIIPIEVKSGKVGKMKSLLVFLAQHDSVKRAVHFGLHSYKEQRIDYKLAQIKESISVKAKVQQIPLYLIDQLHELI